MRIISRTLSLRYPVDVNILTYKALINTLEGTQGFLTVILTRNKALLSTSKVLRSTISKGKRNIRRCLLLEVTLNET